MLIDEQRKIDNIIIQELSRLRWLCQTKRFKEVTPSHIGKVQAGSFAQYAMLEDNRIFDVIAELLGAYPVSRPWVACCRRQVPL